MRRLAPISAMLLIAATGGCHRQEPPAPQASAPETAAEPQKQEPLDVSRAQAGKRAPDAPFEAADGVATTLAAFKGKPVLLNLWATWCGPCVREMPTLDALAKAEGDKLAVVTVSQDMQGRGVVDAYFAGKKLVALKPWIDKNNGLMLALKEASLPLSVLYDAEGKEVWRVRGDMDWRGAKAKALLAEVGA